jgi:hypothetical protein
MSCARPVVHEPFSYSGSRFYVTIDGHDHERADPQTLHQLLTYTEPDPVYTKAGNLAKRQPPPHQDSPWHFYTAQLVHYGLKPLKTKDAAKRNLLAAFGADRCLSVPDRILELEERLEREYQQANKVAKKKYMAEKRRKRDKLRQRREAILQQFADVVDLDLLRRGRLDEFDSDSDGDEVSRARLRDAIATLSETDMRKILTGLLDDIPDVVHAVRDRVRRLHLYPTTKRSEGEKELVRDRSD